MIRSTVCHGSGSLRVCFQKVWARKKCWGLTSDKESTTPMSERCYEIDISWWIQTNFQASNWCNQALTWKIRMNAPQPETQSIFLDFGLRCQFQKKCHYGMKEYCLCVLRSSFLRFYAKRIQKKIRLSYLATLRCTHPEWVACEYY